MKQEVVIVSHINDDNIRFLCLNSFDKILQHSKRLSKEQVLEVIRNLRDELDRF